MRVWNISSSSMNIIKNNSNFPIQLWMVSPLSSYQGCPSEPFEIYLLTDINTDHRVDLYSKNSNSIPYQPSDNRWYHLNPHWYFTDADSNKVEQLTLSNRTLTSVGGVMGYLLSAEFCYHDDLPSDDITIYATLDVSDIPVYSDSSTLPGYANSKVRDACKHNVINLTPKKMAITIDGISPLLDFYWKSIPFSFVITINGETPDKKYSPILKDQSFDSIMAIWSPDSQNAEFEITNNYSITGGFVGCRGIIHDKLENTMIKASYNSMRGDSNLIEICDNNDYEFRKINENWNARDNIKKIIKTPHMHNNPFFWDNYMASLWGDDSDLNWNSFGNRAYERISNFISNHSDIDTCNIEQVYNIAQLLDVSIDDYNIDLPYELKRVMDIMSINLQILRGVDCGCNRNITNKFNDTKTKCEVCGHYHFGNRGELFDPYSYMVTAYKPFIIKDRATDVYDIIVPPKMECLYCDCDPGRIGCGIVSDPLYPNGCDFIINVPRVIKRRPGEDDYATKDRCSYDPIQACEVGIYPLPGFSHLLFPDHPNVKATANDFEQIVQYYCFYEYVYTDPCDVQVKGIIDRSNPSTTINMGVTSQDKWYGESQTIERAIDYALRKGLNLKI